MHPSNPFPQPGRGRRTYSPEFKAQLVAACRIPGMSVASVARNHGINHNILHRWLRELPELVPPRLPGTVSTAVPDFIELPITAPLASPAAPTDSIRLELVRRDLSLTVHWPASAAPSCAQWLLELLR
ncbi:hypothetical protein B9Z45_15925 [Limnohabitans sp. 2KL-17]|uniref:IS66-like element accessory protein TnpA n=1 Tax=Limnohabitans sp. 2KL-17 TaxID=1100704 RepID=UPI000D3D0FDF|nr:transposase [Limnohabitans sp. 2KL-17]PUE48552.1 hypothetical protein B9Z45_15925 [Limnohabitans sp. 2KL-17]